LELRNYNTLSWSDKESYCQKFVDVNTVGTYLKKEIISHLKTQKNENTVTYLTNQYTVTYANEKFDGHTRIIHYKKLLLCSYQEILYLIEEISVAKAQSFTILDY
jgi:hypothetical protein